MDCVLLEVEPHRCRWQCCQAAMAAFLWQIDASSAGSHEQMCRWIYVSAAVAVANTATSPNKIVTLEKGKVAVTGRYFLRGRDPGHHYIFFHHYRLHTILSVSSIYKYLLMLRVQLSLPTLHLQLAQLNSELRLVGLDTCIQNQEITAGISQQSIYLLP